MRAIALATAAVLAIAVPSAACKADRPAPAADPAPAPAPAPVAPADGSGSAKSLDDVMGQIVGQLEKEKAQRPNPGPSVEDVLAALAAGKLAPAETKQVVAATARARYCASGVTADRVNVAVCEYASPADAEAGRTFVMAKYAQLNPSRVIVVVGATTVTVSGRPAADLEARYKPVLDAI